MEHARATRRSGCAALAVAILGATLVGCGAPPAAVQTDGPRDCEQAAQVTQAQPEFTSDVEALHYFEQLAEQASMAVDRYEHALRALRDDRRWAEPDQRIWLAIATTETLTAIEENRQSERQAREQVALLARR